LVELFFFVVQLEPFLILRPNSLRFSETLGVDGVEKRKPSSDCFQLDSDPMHTCPQSWPCQIALRARFTPCHAVELLYLNKFSFPCT